MTRLFGSPEKRPNVLEATNERFRIAEEVSERAYLVDWNGKVVYKVDTESHNVSGIATGGGCLLYEKSPPRVSPVQPLLLMASEDGSNS
jgi:hypothetical protein